MPEPNSKFNSGNAIIFKGTAIGKLYIFILVLSLGINESNNIHSFIIYKVYFII